MIWSGLLRTVYYADRLWRIGVRRLDAPILKECSTNVSFGLSRHSEL